MEYVLNYFIILAIIFIVDYIIEYMILGKKNRFESSKSVNFILLKHKIKADIKKRSTLTKITVLANSVILSIPMTLALTIDPKYTVVVCGISFFVFMFALFQTYNQIGKILKKKGW